MVHCWSNNLALKKWKHLFWPTFSETFQFVSSLSSTLPNEMSRNLKPIQNFISATFFFQVIKKYFISNEKIKKKKQNEKLSLERKYNATWKVFCADLCIHSNHLTQLLSLAWLKAYWSRETKKKHFDQVIWCDTMV